MEKEVFKNNVLSFTKLLSIYLNKKEASDLVIDKELLSFYVRLAKHHSLRAILYVALKSVKANVNEEYLKKLEEYYLLTLRKAVLFDKERNELYEWLNSHQVPYLPLKGIILKDYYPDPYVRELADNDILFKGKDEIVKQFFTDRKYAVKAFKTSNHDAYLKKPFYNFEMHRALFALNEDNEKIVTYFTNYLDKDILKKDFENYLKPEDFYIYFTAHSYKHYHVSGCGLRTLLDYYLFLKNNKLDFDYINEELAKIDLLEFSNSISSLSLKVFDDEPLNEDEEEMLLYIASSGTYGTIEHSVEKGVKEKGKFKYFCSRAFPPMSYYKIAYPRIYKTKVLIPFACLHRLLKNLRKGSHELKIISKQKKEKD